MRRRSRAEILKTVRVERLHFLLVHLLLLLAELGGGVALRLLLMGGGLLGQRHFARHLLLLTCCSTAVHLIWLDLSSQMLLILDRNQRILSLGAHNTCLLVLQVIALLGGRHRFHFLHLSASAVIAVNRRCAS